LNRLVASLVHAVASSDEGIGTAPNEANYPSKGELIAGIPEDIV
jgi:hypothetical protein